MLGPSKQVLYKTSTMSWRSTIVAELKRLLPLICASLLDDEYDKGLEASFYLGIKLTCLSRLLIGNIRFQILH